MATVTVKNDKKIGFVKITRDYRCSCCGDEKSETNTGFRIFGHVIDFRWFPFISILTLDKEYP